jgi:hypothetical protein
MIKLYSQTQFDSAHYLTKLPLQCHVCQETFYVTKKYIKTQILNPNCNPTGKTCSHKCSNILQNKSQSVNCKNCDTTFIKKRAEIKRSKNNFCSKSCAVIFNNTNNPKRSLKIINCKKCDVPIKRNSFKETHTICEECRPKHININCNCSHCNTMLHVSIPRFNKSKHKRFFCNRSCRASYNNIYNEAVKFKNPKGSSKLEKWLQHKLLETFPQLNFSFNDRKTLQLELDIYIPSLKLAIEINGVFHYKPIFGVVKYNSTINNDIRKKERCIEKNIDLTIIDVSSENFSTKTCNLHFEFISNLIIKSHSSRKVECGHSLDKTIII